MVDIDRIIQYEQGEMSDTDTVTMFQEMIDDGTCWKLQGHYGRVASSLIKNGYCTQPGKGNDRVS
jgi:hypothetical protein